MTGDDFYSEGQPGYKYVMWAELYEMEDYAYAIMPVNSLQVLKPWHEKETELTDGREITKAEFESGAAVCMVPSSLAKVNGIRVGDEIKPTLFHLWPRLRFEDAWNDSRRHKHTVQRPRRTI